MKSPLRNFGERGQGFFIARIAIFAVYVFLLGVTAWLNSDQINPDAVSYIRVAQYLATGQTDLVVVGYWGPMLSWLMVPWLFVFEQPLYAARATMVVSATVYLFGAFFVFRSLKLSPAVVTLGLALTAFLGLPWAVFSITPDLLMAGILCCGSSLLMSDKWSAGRSTAFFAGMILGASYLAKAAALPASVVIVLCVAGTHCIIHRDLRRSVRAAIVTLAGILIVAGPWIGILSEKYGRPVFSTSGAINHSIVGPPHPERLHPSFYTFHKPEAGRMSSWEDPTYLPYKYWSPLSSLSFARHQAKLVTSNAHTVIRTLGRFDLLGIGLFCCVFAYLFASPWRRKLHDEPWRWSLIPVMSIGLLYLPVYANQMRYYWVTVPFLLAASLGFAPGVISGDCKWARLQRSAALGLVSLSFVGANLTSFGQAFSMPPNPELAAARILNENLAAAGLGGPVVGVGRNHISYYLAFISDAPWHGRVIGETNIREVLESDAGVVVALRDSAITKELGASPCYSGVDIILNEDDDELLQLPVEVFVVSSDQEDCVR